MVLNIEVLGFIRNVCDEGDAACDPANDTLTLMTPKCDILVYKAGPNRDIALAFDNPTGALAKSPCGWCPIRAGPRGACSASTLWPRAPHAGLDGVPHRHQPVRPGCDDAHLRGSLSGAAGIY